MRHLPRMQLPRRVSQSLEKYQHDLDKRIADVEAGRERTEIVTNFWKSRRESITLQVIEVALKAMASGIARCMYCDEGHGHQIEHFRPKARYVNETFLWENLLWVCGECNEQKCANFDDGILNPTSVDVDPLDHLQLIFDEGRLIARNNSSRGEMTLERIGRLREQDLIKARKTAFDLIGILLYGYPEAGPETRAKIQDIVVNAPLGCVFAAILRAAREQNASAVLAPSLLQVLADYPEIGTWLQLADIERRDRALIDIDVMASRIGVGVLEAGA